MTTLSPFPSLDSEDGTPTRFEEQIQLLLCESFGKESGFQDSSIEKIGEILEAAKEEFELEDNALIDPNFQTRKESFNRCREAYCVLLMELEEQYIGWDPAETIHDLQHKETKTYFLPKITPQEKEQKEEETTRFQISCYEHSFLAQTKAYLGAAKFFASEAILYGFSTTLAAKFRGQTLCLAVESEAGQKFKHGIEHLWPNRAQALEPLLESIAPKPGLRPELLDQLNELNERHKNWHCGGRFPQSGVLGSLRYLRTTPKIEKFEPTLLDLGTLMLLFGDDSMLGTFARQNQLRISGLTENETIELSFRFFYIYKIKKMLSKTDIESPLPDFAQLELSVERTLELLHRLSYKPSQTADAESDDDEALQLL